MSQIKYLALVSALLVGCQSAPPGEVIAVTPAGGALEGQLARASAQARAQGLAPVVDLGSSWCDPCAALEAQLDEAPVRHARRGALLIRVDVDDFPGELKALGLDVPAVPALVALDERGRGTARRIDGRALEIGDPAQTARALEAFLHP